MTLIERENTLVLSQPILLRFFNFITIFHFSYLASSVLNRDSQRGNFLVGNTSYHLVL